MDKEISNWGVSLLVLAAGVPGGITLLVFGQVEALLMTVVVLLVALWCTRGRKALPTESKGRPVEPW